MVQTSTESFRGNLEQTQTLLRAVYGVFPVVAGVDKFLNLLADWPTYLPTIVTEILPVTAQTFMYGVGIVEIVAGLIVLWRTEPGAYLVAAWLTAIALTQVVAGNYDIAVRDLWIAVGAIALAQLAAADRV